MHGRGQCPVFQQGSGDCFTFRATKQAKELQHPFTPSGKLGASTPMHSVSTTIRGHGFQRQGKSNQKFKFASKCAPTRRTCSHPSSGGKYLNYDAEHQCTNCPHRAMVCYINVRKLFTYPKFAAQKSFTDLGRRVHYHSHPPHSVKTSEEYYTCCSLIQGSDRFKMELLVNGIPLQMEIDTNAGMSTVSQKKLHFLVLALNRHHTDEPIVIIGTFIASVQHGSESVYFRYLWWKETDLQYWAEID